MFFSFICFIFVVVFVGAGVREEEDEIDASSFSVLGNTVKQRELPVMRHRRSSSDMERYAGCILSLLYVSVWVCLGAREMSTVHFLFVKSIVMSM